MDVDDRASDPAERQARVTETVATVQVDFVQPQRFRLGYVGPDGTEHRPVMVHRGVVGSMERVLALLLQVHSGRLPFWLNPHQLVVLPVAGSGASGDEAGRAAAQLADRCAPARADVVIDGSLGHRIRAARERRAGLIAVIGPREAADGTVDVLDPSDGQRRTVAAAALAAVLRRAIAERRPPRWEQ